EAGLRIRPRRLRQQRRGRTAAIRGRRSPPHAGMGAAAGHYPQPQHLPVDAEPVVRPERNEDAFGDPVDVQDAGLAAVLGHIGVDGLREFLWIEHGPPLADAVTGTASRWCLGYKLTVDCGGIT